ncbi:hypothetical protein CIK81_03530 [Brachybacterium sp. JB7]|uniref:Uncharacterized protein n=1 Tax=Brachybacterium alimentarium TaxID=47845 RepID=A0A2A3YJ09_9MICO|nr:hypothetical protein CIK71_08185 [Brachybacterium alimentarium]RCS66283.1 hypothetical protein CIK81_03530 [Brachybacterium sp. JB7]PCC39336.1 hypothetical protein CIK66_08690 [Brachybacterium alimentarium]RCS69559.1 hypothetical protein CIK73_05350 [Brachybacterium alimentarium]RCS79295.1 hypothetical protein CIK72_09825 [Brachybacterium alimentarium]
MAKQLRDAQVVSSSRCVSAPVLHTTNSRGLQGASGCSHDAVRLCGLVSSMPPSSAEARSRRLTR